MEFGKRLTSITEETRITTEKGESRSKTSIPEEKKIRECHSRASMIPVLKNEIKIPALNQKLKKCSSKFCKSPQSCQEKEEFERKLKSLEEKEKSVAEYYRKIDEIMRQLSDKLPKEKIKLHKPKSPKNSKARKITSDPLMFNKTKIKNDVFSDFEHNVQQISEIWLKTSHDLSSTLKNLKNNPSFDPLVFEMENVRIQMAIKQARSITLAKTRNIIVEAKKLFRNRELIRKKLEDILSAESVNQELGKRKCQKEESEKDMIARQPAIKEKPSEARDSPKDTDSESREEKEKKYAMEDSSSSSGEKGKSSDYALKEQNQAIKLNQSAQSVTDVGMWAKELARKNETIANLSNKIFDLQKLCNEHSIKYNKLQVELSQFHEKVQWNQILWKQIGRLKLQIKGLQQSNKQLESQKKELEGKITKLDQELDRLIKLNHIFNQKEQLLTAQKVENDKIEDCNSKGDEIKISEKSSDGKFGFGEKVFLEKQNAINQLKSILNLMRDQENFAQKQISMFQSKIKEIEKNALTKS